MQVDYNGRGAIYSFDSVLTREVQEPLPCWELSMPDIIRRTQRRRSPRTPLQKPIRFTLRACDQPELCLRRHHDRTSVPPDLALVSTAATKETGTQIQFSISPEISGLATVIWSEPQTDADGVFQLPHRPAFR